MHLFGDKRILTVSQLTGLIRGILEENFDHVWVEGEVSNLASPGSGHLYFTLKDAAAQLRCVVFRASSRALRFKLANGMNLVLRGKISVYDQRGDYQFIAEYLEPKGIGALQLAFAQLKEKLNREGLFDDSRKKALPGLPKRIGVVTSPTGAAIHDILTVLRRRHAGIDVLLRPVRVQGEGAANEIAEALDDFNKYGQVDVLIVGRGGGSMEDLWAFNEEVVARAIFRSRLPVISAIGHETDFTIADFVADLRAPTPSAAAELVVRSREELSSEVRHLCRRLRLAMEHRQRVSRDRLCGLLRSVKDPALLVGHLMQRVDDLSERLFRGVDALGQLRYERLAGRIQRLQLCNPSPAIERSRERIISAVAQLERSLNRSVETARERVAVAAASLGALYPRATLARGYSIVHSVPEGRVVRDSRQIAPGDSLYVIFSHGSATCSVTVVSGEQHGAPNLTGPADSL